MSGDSHKKYTIQAKRGIKGEAFFEALISDYSLPHHVVGPRDVGVDYFCEWVYGDRPTGILFATQVKTFSSKTVKLDNIGVEDKLNGLNKYEIKNNHLKIDEDTKNYWKGLGIPVYLFVIIESDEDDMKGSQSLNCYYKRFTSVLTTERTQEEQAFYQVNDGTAFIAFLNKEERTQGFARDLFIDHIRWNYYKGSITYLNPRSIGLNQFPEAEGVFGDMILEYKDKICITYQKTKYLLEGLCKK